MTDLGAETFGPFVEVVIACSEPGVAEVADVEVVFSWPAGSNVKIVPCSRELLRCLTAAGAGPERRNDDCTVGPHVVSVEEMKR